MAKDTIFIEPAVAELGVKFIDDLMDANIAKAIGGGLGGCEPLNLEDYPIEYRDIIKKYLYDDNFDSTAAIYLAMDRKAKEIKETG